MKHIVTLRILAAIAIAGFFVCLAAHMATFFGINPEHEFPPTKWLGFIIFAVWIPVVKIGVDLKKQKGELGVLMRLYAPKWMIVTTIFFFVYGIVVLFFEHRGVPNIINGQKVLHSHGTVIRTLTDQEYETELILVVRKFSETWLVFYSAAMTILFAKFRERFSRASTT